MSTSRIFDYEFPTMSVVLADEQDGDPIVLDDLRIKALVARALLDAGELVAELAAQNVGDPAEDTRPQAPAVGGQAEGDPGEESRVFGELIWDVDPDLIPEAIQIEILRLVRAGFVMCIRDAVADIGVHHNS